MGLGSVPRLPATNSYRTVCGFSARAKGDLRRMRDRPVANYHCNSSRIEVELSASSHSAFQDALSEVLKVYTPLKPEVFVVNIKIHVW